MYFAVPNGAAARVAAQHSQDFASWYAHIPGLKVVQPYCAADAKALLKSAIRDPGPVVFLENEILYGRKFEVPVGQDITVPIGQARIRREGQDLTILSFGIGVSHALEAAEALSAEGISAEVIDLRSLRPLDTDTVIQSMVKTNRCITVVEGWPVCSIGSYVASVVMRDAFDWARRTGAEHYRQGHANAVCRESRETCACQFARNCRGCAHRPLSLSVPA